VLIKNFKAFAESMTQRVKAAAYQAAASAGRGFRYLPRPDIPKEELARQIARDEQISSGLIAVFSAVEHAQAPPRRRAPAPHRQRQLDQSV
jgi:hypothetical protein